MTDWKEYAAYYIERLGGRDSVDAYHSLIEADNAVIPFLIEAFRTEQDPTVRSDLVEVIWQHRLPETIEFLSEALDDLASKVWKNALDGLVCLGGQAAIDVLESAKSRIQSGSRAELVQIEWIDEAIQQVREQDA